MRRIKNNRQFYNKILNRKLSINFIVLFFIIELLLIPFTVASFTPRNGLDDDIKTTDSGSSPPAIEDAPSESSTGTVVKDESSTSSNSGTTVVDDTQTNTNSGTTVVDDTQTNTNSGTTVVDDTQTDSTDNSYTTNDKTSDSGDNYYLVDDKLTDSGDSNLSIDKKLIDSTVKTLLDDTSNYAPNERDVSTNEIVMKTENTVVNLASGIEKEIILESSKDIDSIKLTPATDLKEVKVTVIKLKDKPEDIIDPPKRNVSIYKYLDIKLIANNNYMDEEEISSLEFNFKVEKTWIAENKIDKLTVRLIRYHDGVWQNLSTELSSENETYIYYTATSPGFSTFAVVGSKVIEKSESYGSDDVSIPWSIIIGFIITLSIMLVFILFKARYLYLKEDNK